MSFQQLHARGPHGVMECTARVVLPNLALHVFPGQSLHLAYARMPFAVQVAAVGLVGQVSDQGCAFPTMVKQLRHPCANALLLVIPDFGT